MNAGPQDTAGNARTGGRTDLPRYLRRHPVPWTMIERATECRLDGDWEGACEAAGVDVWIDLDRVRRDQGVEAADAVQEDLLHLVPDLLRWHFPRALYSPAALVPADGFELSRHGDGRGPRITARLRWDDAGTPEGVILDVDTDAEPDRGRGEEVLRQVSRHLWDARYVHETRERWGGSAERAPFLNPDGTPRTVAELPTADPGPGDPAARTEWIDHLHRTGRMAEAFAAAGIVCDPGDFPGGTVPDLAFLSPALLSAGFSRLTAAGGPERACVRLREDWDSPRLEVRRDGDRIRLGHLDRTDDAPLLPEALWKRPPDLDVLRDGLSPDHLHPLLREALAPARPPADGPVGPPPWEPVAPVRARCGKEWHTLSLRDGRLVTPHTGEEQARERALSALGGTVSPCFRAAESWRTGRGWLPKGLHARRAELFERIRHGDTGALVDYLDTGGDPRVRDGELNTLLHELYHLDHTVLLPRLLEAGLDVDAENGLRSTPVHRALRYGGDPSLVRALIAAGARTRAIAYDRSRPLDLQSELESVSGHRVPADPERWRELLEELRGPEGPAAPGRGLPRPRRDP
ncbi:ankyrin repeat domain-containing protein [Nocardiopsis changdeensis]|uniref:ankyrin repeat domain-containing protein n=1 Tax=Nocardiopsis changdeensis TaxID=2831969 RepID=UPI003F466712